MHTSKMKAKINKNQSKWLIGKQKDENIENSKESDFLKQLFTLIVEEIFAARNFCGGHFGDLT